MTDKHHMFFDKLGIPNRLKLVSYAVINPRRNASPRQEPSTGNTAVLLGFKGFHLFCAVALFWIAIQFLALNFVKYVFAPRIEIASPPKKRCGCAR
jgi:hypothetical protein